MSTLIRLALRSHTGGVIAAALIASFAGLANALAYSQVAGTTAAERAVFAQQMQILGRQFSYMLPAPLELDTVAGYLLWRYFGFATIIVAFWALIAASGAGRGDEDRGLVEQWLAAGVSRARYLLTRTGAFAVVLLGAMVVQAISTYAGVVAAGETIAASRLALQSFALWALGTCVFAIALLISQLASTRRGAGGLAGIVVAALFILNSLARNDVFTGVQWISPFWLHERTNALLRDGSLDVAATSALVGASAVLVALAAAAFAARDLGASLLRATARTGRPTFRPSRDPLLRIPVLAGLDRQRVWIAGWMLGIAVVAAWLISLTRTMVDAMLAIPGLRAYAERLGLVGYDTFVGFMWGSTALFLLAVFAIFQVSAWTADDAEGRLESVLTQPVSRGRVVVERATTLLAALVIIVTGSAAAVYASALAADIGLSWDRFALASALMPTVPFAFAGVGAVISSWRPRLAVPVLMVVAFAGYFIQQFGPIFEWPAWLQRTSIFELYGTPITGDVDWTGIGILVAIGVVGTAIGVVLMRRRDIGS